LVSSFDFVPHLTRKSFERRKRFLWFFRWFQGVGSNLKKKMSVIYVHVVLLWDWTKNVHGEALRKVSGCLHLPRNFKKVILHYRINKFICQTVNHLLTIPESQMLFDVLNEREKR
jgi:hypothetical protein